ncbi:MAG: hypothetical protein PVJ84_12905 [Desulfobacteraceae bacterium]
MRIVFMSLTTCLYLISCSVGLAHEKTPPENDHNDIQKYYKKNYPAGTIDVSSLSLTNCQNGINIGRKLVLVACRSTSLDTPSDSGLRLFLIQSDQNEILYYSKGAGDSYYMNYSIFQKKGINQPLIVLAEVGAEFSYGVNVFMVNGRKMTYIGSIDETVNINENPSSVVPFLKISEYQDKIQFCFTKDVLVLSSKGEYITVSKKKIKYSYDLKSGLVRSRH